MPVTSRYSSPVNYQSILGTDSYKYFSNSSRYFNSIPSSTGTTTTTKRGSGNNDTSSPSAYSNRFVSSFSNCNRSSTSSAIRSSLDRDTLTKPPIGSSTLARLRSESRLRDHSLDSGAYLSSTTKSSHGQKTNDQFSHLSAPYKRHSLKNISSDSSYTSNPSSSSSTPSSRLTLPSPSSSLEHYVAISSLDIQKYSPANYIPRHELLRSRSLSEATSNKLNAIDKSSSSSSSSASGTTATSTTTPSSATSKYNRSTSNDRDATNKVKKFNNVKHLPSTTHLTNRNTNNINNNNKTYSNSRNNNCNKSDYCHLIINNSSDSIVDFQNNINNNNNCYDLTNNDNNNLKNSIDITSVKFSQKFPKYPAACNVASVANVNNNNINNNSNNSNSNFYENNTINSNNNNIKQLQTTNCNRNNNNNNNNNLNNSNESVTININMLNDNDKINNNNIINYPKKNINRSSNEELKRDMEFITKQLGVPPLTTSHLKNGSQFLKSEYENARNQVISNKNTNKKVSDIYKNNNNDNTSILNRKIINTSYNTNISNINNNQNTVMIEKTNEFDDIKFIDSDESGERKASPTTRTMILSTKDLINNLNNHTSSSLRYQQKTTVSPLRTSPLLSYTSTSPSSSSASASSSPSSVASSSLSSISSKLPNVSKSATSTLSSPKIQTIPDASSTFPITIKRTIDVQKINKYNTLSSADKTPYLNEIIAANGPISVGGGGGGGCVGSTGIYGGRTSPKQILTSTITGGDKTTNLSNITPIIASTTTTTTMTMTMTTTTIPPNNTAASPVAPQQIANKLRKNDLLNEFIANNNNINVNSNNNNNNHNHNNINIKNENIRNSSSVARLPPSSASSLSSSATNRFRDRDGGGGGASGGGTAIGGARTSSRTLSDSDAFNRSSLISSSSDKLSNSDNSEGLCGLRNIGNTCYMNSVLQCLSHTNELTQYLKYKSEGRSQTKDERILNEFISLIKEMWSPNTRTVTPSELKSAFSSKHRMYYGSIQQDAQEFLRFFLDSLHCGLNNKGVKGEKLVIDDSLSDNCKADLTWEWYSKIENSKIKDLFVGQLKSSLKCTVCGNTSVTFDPFWDLSVPLTPLSTSSKCKLESCMDLFIKEEILDGDEMPTCSKCNTRRKSTKSLTIQRFPKYLVIHLKRFSETRWSKIANIVEFPTGDRGLNMAPYAANSSSVIYSLYGISNHMGSTAEGHYVALCKHPVTKKWHEFNDNSVSDRSESSLVSSSAYLLFYERS